MSTGKILLAGDSAVTVQFGETIDPAIYAKVKSLNEAIEGAKPKGIIETIPTFRSLMVQYDPLLLPYAELVTLLEGFMQQSGKTKAARKKVITIPVCFGGSKGPDLQDVADYHHMTTDEVVRLCCSKDVLIYMLGFTPGYPYIGGMPEELATPRLISPRLKVPAGSVGIGGEQLGVYSVESPGGFRLIGKTPLHLYDPFRRKNTVLLEAGEYIRFKAINELEYGKIAKEEQLGTYQYEIREE